LAKIVSGSAFFQLLEVFPDEVDITVRAGNGGPGCVSFLRAASSPGADPTAAMAEPAAMSSSKSLLPFAP